MTTPKKLSLTALRLKRTRTQLAVAARTGWKESVVSRLERGEGSCRVDTLQRYVKALGGQLRLVAVFRDDEFEIDV